MAAGRSCEPSRSSQARPVEEPEMKLTSTARLKYPGADLVRQVTDRERENYERDGAAILKRVIPLEWVEYMRAAVDRLLKWSDQSSQNYADEGQPRFFAQAFPWLS